MSLGAVWRWLASKKVWVLIGVALVMLVGAVQTEESLDVEGITVRYGPRAADQAMAYFYFDMRGYRNTYLLDCENREFRWIENRRLTTGQVTGNSAGAVWRSLNPRSAKANAVYDAICPVMLAGMQKEAGEEAAFLPESVIAAPPGGDAVRISEKYLVRASRLFAGKVQYPPREFAAYGIVAFPSAATAHDRDRFIMVCQAYSAVLPHTSELPDVPQREQMVTVWPVTSAELADDLNADPRSEVDASCEQAVDSYDAVIARRAINEAEAVGASPYLRGNGPYLLAWSPGSTKGASDALVLVADLSYMNDYEAMRDVFLRWAEDIEQNPELWRRGWAVERVRQAIRVWADRFGAQVMAFVTGE